MTRRCASAVMAYAAGNPPRDLPACLSQAGSASQADECDMVGGARLQAAPWRAAVDPAALQRFPRDQGCNAARLPSLGPGHPIHSSGFARSACVCCRTERAAAAGWGSLRPGSGCSAWAPWGACQQIADRLDAAALQEGGHQTRSLLGACLGQRRAQLRALVALPAAGPLIGLIDRGCCCHGPVARD